MPHALHLVYGGYEFHVSASDATGDASHRRRGKWVGSAGRPGILHFLRASARLHDGAADVCGQRKDGGRRGSEEARGDPEGIAASRAGTSRQKKPCRQQYFL